MSLDTKGWLTQARLDARVVALVTADRSLAQERTDEQSDAHGSHDDELERVPACPQHDEVEPAGREERTGDRFGLGRECERLG